MHIVEIDGIESIIYARSLIHGAWRHRSKITRTVTIQLSKRKSRTRTDFEQYKAIFNTFRPILASFQAVICSHQTVLPSPPVKVKYEYQAYAGKYKKYFTV